MRMYVLVYYSPFSMSETCRKLWVFKLYSSNYTFHYELLEVLVLDLWRNHTPSESIISNTENKVNGIELWECKQQCRWYIQILVQWLVFGLVGFAANGNTTRKFRIPAKRTSRKKAASVAYSSSCFKPSIGSPNIFIGFTMDAKYHSIAKISEYLSKLDLQYQINTNFKT